MEVRFNVTGTERKALVEAIEKIVQWKAVYKKAPTFEYTVGDIVRATEGSLAPVACLEGEVNTCPRAAECATLYVWAGLKNTVDSYLDSITLQDIIDHGKANVGDDYSI